jgi:hypothetical protein
LDPAAALAAIAILQFDRKAQRQEQVEVYFSIVALLIVTKRLPQTSDRLE